MARMKYLQRRANRFEFRFALPDDIAGKAAPVPWPETLSWCINGRTGRFKQELVRSLRSSDARTAERAALPLIEEAHRLVDICRKALQEGPPTALAPGVIDRLARKREAELLEADEALRLRGLGLDVRSGSVEPDSGFTDDDYQLYRRAIDHLDDMSRNEAARLRGGEALQMTLNRAVEESGIVLHPEDPAWRQLEVAFIKSQRRAIDGIKARLHGDIVAAPAAPAAGETAGSLSDALRRWQQGGGRAARRPSADSAGEAERAVQRFIELHGDLPLTEITKAHARLFRDALAKLPKALPHRLARLPLPKLLQLNLSRYPLRNAQTVNKYLNLLAAILTKAEKDGHFEHLQAWNNPFRVGFEIAHQDREHYQPFSVDELNGLFASPVYASGKRPLAGRGEAAFWFPLISLFTGARRTEIAQLRVRDTRLSSGNRSLRLREPGAALRIWRASSKRVLRRSMAGSSRPPEMDPAKAARIIWRLASPDLFLLLRRVEGASRQAYIEWLAGSLKVLLFGR